MAANPDLALAAALGEHALCLAAAAGDGKAPLPGDRDPTRPGDHADHEGLGCCLWHAAGGFILPPTSAVAPIAFVARLLPRLAPAALTLPRNPTGPRQARAPPQTA